MGKAHSLAYATMPMFFWPAPAIPVRKVLAEATDSLAQEAAARFGYESSTGDWRSVMDDPSIDIVDIATPNHLHCEIAVAAAAAGKHVISEKPLARTAAEAKHMLDAVDKAGVIHMVAFNYRRTPAVQFARQLIDEGSIGEVRNFRGTYLQDWSADPNGPLSWRFQKSLAGSGALGDVATHIIDIARFLVSEIDAVNAMVRTYVTERPVQQGGADMLAASVKLSDAPKAPVDVDDEVLTQLRFASGAIGSIEATRNGWGRHNFLTFEVHGTRGSLVFNYERREELQVFFADDPSDRRGFRTIYTGPAHPNGESLWPIPALGIGYSETKIIECHDFIKAIVDGSQPSPNFQDGYRVAQITDAILESGNTHTWTQVDEPRKLLR
jgi:predicted dehydrogenase